MNRSWMIAAATFVAGVAVSYFGAPWRTAGVVRGVPAIYNAWTGETKLVLPGRDSAAKTDAIALPPDQLARLEGNAGPNDRLRERIDGKLYNGSDFVISSITIRVSGTGKDAPPPRSYDAEVFGAKPRSTQKFWVTMPQDWPDGVKFEWEIVAAIGSSPE